MGTTLTAFKDSDGFQYCFVIAIEGYSYLLTNWHTTSDLFVSGTGWHGTGWTQALSGLSMEGVVFKQSISPWKNDMKGEEVSFSVVDDDGTDRFGIDVFKRGAGNETQLYSTLDNNDTTIQVQSSVNFASSGAVYIGTERIDYGGKTTGSPDTLTGCTRGMYSPFFKVIFGVLVSPITTKLQSSRLSNFSSASVFALIVVVTINLRIKPFLHIVINTRLLFNLCLVRY